MSSSTWRRAAFVASFGAILAAASPAAASADTHVICVGSTPGCVATLDAALVSAHDGDTLRLGPGSYAGGVTVSKSVHLVGAGEGRTVIRGGGPVITIAGTTPALDVSLSQLTVAGGVATGNGFDSRGGGIDIEPTTDGGVGASVTLTDVTVRNNRATATTVSDSPSGVLCPSGFCPFARARGGGIANSGELTVNRSTVRDNRVDGALSDANGGGIFSELGTLTVKSTVVTANHARPTAIGRFSEGGGIFVDSGNLTVQRSQVTMNRADLVTSWPVKAQGTLIDMNANSGGIHIGNGSTVIISDTVISHNAISAIDPLGEPLAFDAGMCACGESSVWMTNTVIEHNRVTADVATTQDVGASGSTLEFDGPAVVTHSRISNNTVSVHSRSGPASAIGALTILNFSDNPGRVFVSDSVIAGNTVRSSSANGTAEAVGAGVFNNGLLELDHVRVRGNTARAASPNGSSAQGGGIWNGVSISGPPVVLALRHTSITNNNLSVSPRGSRQGGGLYTTEPIVRDQSVITRNHPDNCAGCSLR
ncbi:hypothetical protein BA895_00790 [Humibacillus sp. DSM 29435]|uniref:right-handed parallel beta-helix repeat-containing protein n=1 Tax=Humibacillus sp. DSM 29435 TaxID=1869167 RepID=UPI000871CF90|nr:right-handed parallel beta-helix repeat-containing protein [Humibacillus sp. DSM 29435]OFE18764.1 hypothetical protein BA895_00790 [Humibacillus sp. DSM 29435]